MKFDQEKIKKLKRGEISVEFVDGTNESESELNILKELFKEAYPNHNVPLGMNRYYFAVNSTVWASGNIESEKRESIVPSGFLSSEKEFVVPQNWVVKITSQSRQIIKDWCHGKDPQYRCGFYDDQFLYHKSVENFFTWNMDTTTPGYEIYTLISIEEFEKYIAKIIPTIKTKNWFITSTEENNELVCDWYDECNPSNTKTQRTIGVHYGLNKGGDVYGIIPDAAPSEYFDEEITFEQFKKYILKQPVGYKVPYDIPSWSFKKGDVLTFSDNENFYSLNNKGKTVPKEIVETWKPSYKPIKLIVNISKSRQVEVRIGKITAEGREISIDDLKTLIEPPLSNLSGWIVGFSNNNEVSYKIGCWEDVTLSDLQDIIDSYNSMNE